MSLGARVRRWWSSRSAGPDDADALRDRLDAAYREQTAMLAQVRRGVADVATSRKRVQVRLAGLRAQLDVLDTEAAEAVRRGDDDAARSALARRLQIEKAADELADRHAALAGEERSLIASAAKVEQQIEDFRLRKDTLTARYSAANARSEVYDATDGIASATSEVGRAMAEAERHTRELEATADAVDELVAEGLITRPGESGDEALARRIDAALAEGHGDGPHQIPQ